jgi:DNA mismatch endonuclease, patch repair protein
MERMTSESRSRIMRAIRPKNTKPEMLVRRLLHAAGFRYRLHVRTLPGSPDLVLEKYKSVVEVRGCFWHSHSCLAGRLPTTNATYWRAKLEKNRSRDEQNLKHLRRLGYRVKVIWECELQSDRLARTVAKVIAWLARG